MSQDKTTTLEITKQPVNQQDQQGNTALHRALLNGSSLGYVQTEPDFASIEIFLANGGDVKLKNFSELTADQLLHPHKFQTEVYDDDGAWKFGDRIISYRKKYFNLVMKYQPTFENIKFFFESGVTNYCQTENCLEIKVFELSQDCLENLVLWCKKGIEIFDQTAKPSTIFEGSLDKSAVPSHLCDIKLIKKLLQSCETELYCLKQYPYLTEIVEKILAPCYREAILTAFMQEEDIKYAFDLLLAQLEQLPLNDELKAKIRVLDNELKERIQKNYPQYTSLNEEGKSFIFALFDKLKEILCERQAQLDIQKATSSKLWQNTITNSLVERFNAHKSEHQKSYSSVLSQLTAYQPQGIFINPPQQATTLTTQSNTSASLVADETIEERRRRLADAAERRFNPKPQ